MHTGIGQLLVHVDTSSRSAARLQVARQLALQHEAALSAFYAVTPAVTIAAPYEAAGMVAPGFNMVSLDEERRDCARARFDEAMKKPGAPATWNELTEFSAIGAFARQALYADLMVLGQHDPSQAEPADVPADFAEAVIAASGKPALVIPWALTPAAIGRTVVIAWKETPESARAVKAALPLLQKAQRVHVVSWAAVQDNAMPGSLGLGSYLQAHGVQAQFHSYGDEPVALGELLLSAAFDLEADLLVMGCYGHSRAREWVLGGTSRTILRSMTLPVLLAH